MKKIKNAIMKSFLVKLAYKSKFYTDIGVSQVSWFTGKLPEIMAAAYILEKFGIVITAANIVVLGLLLFFTIFMLGWFLKNSGLFDVDQYVSAQKNPVQEELLRAARLIIREFDKKK